MNSFGQILIVVFVLIEFAALEDQMFQEAAVLDKSNPVYIRNVSVITYRMGRRSRYLTNVTATLLHEWNNNVTFITEFVHGTRSSNKLFAFSYKLCDAFQVKWVKDLIVKHSEIIGCPIPPKTYRFTNMETSMSSVPFLKGLSDVRVIMRWIITETKELISEGSVRIKIMTTVQKHKSPTKTNVK